MDCHPRAHGPAIGSKYGITGSGGNDRFYGYYQSGVKICFAE